MQSTRVNLITPALPFQEFTATSNKSIGAYLVYGLNELLLLEIGVLGSLAQLADHLIIALNDSHVLRSPLHVFLNLLNETHIILILKLGRLLLIILPGIHALTILLLPDVVLAHFQELLNGIDLFEILIKILCSLILLFLLDVPQHFLKISILVNDGYYLKQLLHDCYLPIAFFHWIQRNVQRKNEVPGQSEAWPWVVASLAVE